MASYVLHAAEGDVPLGHATQNPNTKRWEVESHGRTFSWRDAEGAVEALALLHAARVPLELPF